jgi:hypothetical protein
MSHSDGHQDTGGEMTIDTGDTVMHIPTGETWLVACVQGNDLSWCGWPEGYAKVKDCRLIRKAPPEERLALLERLADMQGHDHRQRYACHVLKAQP